MKENTDPKNSEYEHFQHSVVDDNITIKFELGSKWF